MVCRRKTKKKPTKKWGRIGAPKSAERKKWIKKMRSKVKTKRRKKK